MNAKILYLILVYVLFFIFVFSCTPRATDPLSIALTFAGDNRSELEKVLNHYLDDTLKYKAACFLIGNMPPLYSYSQAGYRTTHAAMKKAVEDKDHDVQLLNVQANTFNRIEKIYDVQVITADYLIETIDFAFKLWREKPWNKYLSFEDFCEYLLPYRVGNEPLESWQMVYYEKYNAILDSLYSGTDVVEAANLLSLHLAKTEKITYLGLSHINPGALFYLDNRCGDCVDMRDMSIYLLRSVGIPAGGDFYSISPNEGASMHTWAIVQDTTGKSVAFRHPGLEVRRNLDVEYKKGKVYRLCYGKQSKKEVTPDVAPFFQNRYLRDVTSNYVGENQYLIPVEVQKEAYAYLGVHTAERTTLIDMGEIKEGRATFKNVEPGLIYQLFSYSGTGIESAGFPVLLKERGQFHQFVPDTTRRESVRIYRKYRLAEWLSNYMNRMVGGVIEGANDPSFAFPVFHYAITDSVRDIITKSFYPGPLGHVRYIRFKAAYNKKIDLAEITFYNEQTGTCIRDMAISGSSPAEIYKNGSLKNIADGDLLTYYMSADTGAVVLFDFRKEVELSQIEITPHTDDNYIRKGDTYELFYHAGREGWKTLGRQTAVELYLDYSDVPQNSLLWLHNHSRGREEQVFYMKDGKQVFTGRTEAQGY